MSLVLYLDEEATTVSYTPMQFLINLISKTFKGGRFFIFYEYFCLWRNIFQVKPFFVFFLHRYFDLVSFFDSLHDFFPNPSSPVF